MTREERAEMRRSEDIECARRSILLNSVPDDVLDDILAHSSVREYERGSSIFLEGEPAHSVFIVLNGWVKLFRVSPSGAEAIVNVFTQGQSFGEAVAFRNSVYPVNSEAVTNCRLLRIDTGAMLAMMHARPELCMAILSATFQHLHNLVGQVEQLKSQTGAQRLAEFLLELCPVGEGACTVTLPYDKVVIAGRLGMKPESLSRAFARLHEAGVWVNHDHAAIRDVQVLRDFVNQDRAELWRKTR